MEEKSFNQELIVQYLLGDLPDEEQVRIEDRAFSDRQYLRNIEAVESDLIDEYVRGGLSAHARRQFERRFLASRERQQKVEFARALAKVSSELAATDEVVTSSRGVARGPLSLWESFVALIGGARPAARFSLAAASLLLVIGVSWLAVQTIRLRGELSRLRAEQQAQRQQQEEIERQAARERARGEELAAQLQREQRQREQTEELALQLQQERERLARSQKEAARPAAPTIASLFLLPSTLRGAQGRPQLIVPRAARLIRLQIGLGRGDVYKSFRVELGPRAGRIIWSQGRLQPRATRAGRAVILELPASALDAGEYELALKGVNDQGAVEDVGYYYFSVQKR